MFGWMIQVRKKLAMLEVVWFVSLVSGAVGGSLGEWLCGRSYIPGDSKHIQGFCFAPVLAPLHTIVHHYFNRPPQKQPAHIGKLEIKVVRRGESSGGSEGS